jgi:hypothetical protein
MSAVYLKAIEPHQGGHGHRSQGLPWQRQDPTERSLNRRIIKGIGLHSNGAMARHCKALHDRLLAFQISLTEVPPIA